MAEVTPVAEVDAMGMRVLTIQIPEGLFEVLQQRASESHRSVEQELLDTLGKTLAGDEQAKERLENVLSGMRGFSDNQLLDAAGHVLSQASCERSQWLGDKQREQGLTAAERIELESLLTQYEWQMLLRSQALALLQQRGHDISAWFAPPLAASA
ncbi:MAG: hypothetical protein WD872_21170 [Pirellulaceae bacterium]